MTYVLSRFHKKRAIEDPELEAAVRERLEQDMAGRAIQKAAELENWNGIRERVLTSG